MQNSLMLNSSSNKTYCVCVADFAFDLDAVKLKMQFFGKAIDTMFDVIKLKAYEIKLAIFKRDPESKTVFPTIEEIWLWNLWVDECSQFWNATCVDFQLSSSWRQKFLDFRQQLETIERGYAWNLEGTLLDISVENEVLRT